MTTPSDPHNIEPHDRGQGSGDNSAPDPTPPTGGYPPPSYPPPGGAYPPPPPPPSGSYPPPPSDQGGAFPPPPSDQGGAFPPPPSQGGAYPPPPSQPAGGAYPPPPSGSYPPPPSQGGAYPPPPPSDPYPSGSYPSGGAYPPPPSGAYPPAGDYGSPSGGYGASGSGYGAPAGDAYGAVAAPQFSVGDALSYAWSRFSGNAVPWILITLLAGLVTGLINYLGYAIGGNGSFIRIIFSLIAVIVGYIFQGAMIRGALDEVGGSKPAIGSFFQFANVGAVILTALLVAIGTDIGLILCIIPGLIFAFLAFWSLPFTVDRNLQPIEAIKASFSVISKNAGALFPLALVNALILVVGALLCGVGLLVAVPIVVISSTYAYRVFTGGQVAPVGGHTPPSAPPGYPPTQY
ncbi:hypothetical protein AAFP30_10365 [Gordonia sp. CPCC 205515]|uniref:hypothetical protein n=1 Tax=Gordonia sp. CPCC 205515 TaxID=3140791 RepID=UPI003AF3ED5D